MTAASLQRRVADALAPRWMAQLYPTTISGDTRNDLTLDWSFYPDALDALITRELGKRVIFSDRHHWTTAELVTAYRSQWHVEAAFRQIKHPDHARFRPIHHWTDQKIAVHCLYSVAALTLVHLAWREATRNGIDLSTNQLLETLAAIREVTLLYPPPPGHRDNPRILRKLTRTDLVQQQLFDLFQLQGLAPREGNTAKWREF